LENGDIEASMRPVLISEKTKKYWEKERNPLPLKFRSSSTPNGLKAAAY